MILPRTTTMGALKCFFEVDYLPHYIFIIMTLCFYYHFVGRRFKLLSNWLKIGLISAVLTLFLCPVLYLFRNVTEIQNNSTIFINMTDENATYQNQDQNMTYLSYSTRTTYQPNNELTYNLQHFFEFLLTPLMFAVIAILHKFTLKFLITTIYLIASVIGPLGFYNYFIQKLPLDENWLTLILTGIYYVGLTFGGFFGMISWFCAVHRCRDDKSYSELNPQIRTKPGSPLVTIAYRWKFKKFFRTRKNGKPYFETMPFGDENIKFTIRATPDNGVGQTSFYLSFHSDVTKKLAVKYVCTILDSDDEEHYSKEGIEQMLIGSFIGWPKFEVKRNENTNLFKDDKIVIKCEICYDKSPFSKNF